MTDEIRELILRYANPSFPTVNFAMPPAHGDGRKWRTYAEKRANFALYYRDELDDTILRLHYPVIMLEPDDEDEEELD
jgi:hypothetical protein